MLPPLRVQDDSAEPAGLCGQLAANPRRLRILLVSALLHALMLLLCGLAKFVLPTPAERFALVAAGQLDEPVATVETPPLELPPAELALDAPAMPAPSVDVSGLAAVGPSSVEPSVAGVAAASIVPSASGLMESADGTGRRAGAAAASFFGVQAAGHSFVFLVDSSRSMNGGKFEAAIQEVSRAVRRLKPDQRFSVIFFDQQVRPMPLGGDAARPVPATPAHIRALEAWMRDVRLDSGGDPAAAVAMAVELLPDAIFMLSDGQFGAKTERYLQQHNRLDDPVAGQGPKVVVHTIGFYTRRGEQQLQRIAQLCHGTYRFVPKPPRPPQ